MSLRNLMRVRRVISRPGFALLAAALCCAAAVVLSSVGDVVALVRSSVQANQNDKQLAKSLSKLKMSESLDDQTIEELESLGAGAKSVEELEHLRDLSLDLPKPFNPPGFEEPAAPLREEMQRVVHAAREYALAYSHTLPDFICTQVVRRYEDWTGKGAWSLKDTLTLKLSILDGGESYKLVKINDKPTFRSYDSVGGAVSEGEFGSMMAQIFDPAAQAQIRWDHWTHLRKRAAQVYSYRINVANSRYNIGFGAAIGDSRRVIAGVRGLIYVDPETGQIMRATNDAIDLPRGFPVTLATTVLDYDYAEVGGRRYLLPLHAEVRLGTNQIHTRNVVEFSEFRKFTGESTISFDTPVDDKTVDGKTAKPPVVKK